MDTMAEGRTTLPNRILASSRKRDPAPLELPCSPVHCDAHEFIDGVGRDPKGGVVWQKVEDRQLLPGVGRSIRRLITAGHRRHGKALLFEQGDRSGKVIG